VKHYCGGNAKKYGRLCGCEVVTGFVEKKGEEHSQTKIDSGQPGGGALKQIYAPLRAKVEARASVKAVNCRTGWCRVEKAGCKIIGGELGRRDLVVPRSAREMRGSEDLQVGGVYVGGQPRALVACSGGLNSNSDQSRCIRI